MGEIDKRVPQVGMRFRNPDEAWVFWVDYGGRAGFYVRKKKNVSKFDGETTSCRFVCSNEGLPRKRQTLENQPKRFRTETRTDCKSGMTITLDRMARNYGPDQVTLLIRIYGTYETLT